MISLRTPLLAAAVLLAGCRSPAEVASPPPCAGPLGSGPSTGAAPERIVAPSAVQIFRTPEPVRPDFCGAGRPAAGCAAAEVFRGTTAEVVDLYNGRVPAEVTVGRVPPSGIKATVAFPPASAGWHHVSTVLDF